MSERPKKSAVRGSDRNAADPIRIFRRTLHSKGDLRQGLSRARQTIAPHQMPRVVAELSRVSIYAAAIAGDPFPSDFRKVRKRGRLKRLDAEGEFMWSAAVAATFADTIAKFVGERIEYERYLFRGNFAEAETCLQRIERAFGVSLWFVSARIQLLQLREGTAAQKRYLESILDVEGISSIFAFVPYYMSIRSEETISAATFQNEALSLFSYPILGDYARYHLRPGNLNEVSGADNPIYWEETQPIIDRYHALVAMAQLQFVRDPSQRFPIDALKLLSGVGDPRVEKVLALANQSALLTAATTPSLCRQLCDLYTTGQYEKVLDGRVQEAAADAPEVLELLARAHTYAGSVPFIDDQSIVAKAIPWMRDVLLVNENYQKATQNLAKLALTYANHPVAIYLATFIDRSHDYVLVDHFGERENLCAVNGAPDNPWNARLFEALLNNGSYLATLIAAWPSSPSLLLRHVLTLPFEDAKLQLLSSDMPVYRQCLYLGHAAMRNELATEAIPLYQSAADSEFSLIATTGRKRLFAALFAARRINDCLDLVCDQYIANSNSYRLYPVEEFLRAGLLTPATRPQLALAIVAHIAARHFDPAWERDLSDAYEGFLEAVQIERPTELRDHLDVERLDRIVFFLRYICVPRLMDDSVVFEDVADIERERIGVCQLLIDLDNRNAEIYANEIRAITRETEIANLLRSVQESKIYVGDDGIKDVVDDKLRGAYARWQELRQGPQLNYQTDKISKQLKELLDKTVAEVKDIRLPASEHESVFTDMYVQFVNEFALNPAYGLDTHLSTSIRHGAFEGHIRSPIALAELLSARDSKGDYASNTVWRSRLPELSPEEWQQVDRALGRFSEKVDEAIAHVKNDLLHIRGVSEHQQGLFNFNASQPDLQSLMDAITPSTSYDEFIDKLFARCWAATEQSMSAVRDQLRGPFRSKINQAFETLIASIEANVNHQRVADLIDAIARARTDFQTAVEKVSSWFQRATVLHREPFSFDLAVDVALKEIGNCYVKQRFTPNLDVDVPYLLKGTYFDNLVEILFILLQNVIRHSGFEGSPKGVDISAADRDGALLIEVVNDLSPDLDINERANWAAAAAARYKHDTAMKAARSEGGSGLSKIWRILEFEFKVNHGATLEILQGPRFRAFVSLGSDGIPSC